MGRCLSPCLRDLDPNLYRERLDAALALFTGEDDGAAALLDHIERQMRAASAERRYERAAWLRRRHARLRDAARPASAACCARSTRARGSCSPRTRATRRAHDAFWIVGGRVVDWGPLPGDPAELAARTADALRAAPRPELGGWLRAGGDRRGAHRRRLARRARRRTRARAAAGRGPGGARRLGQR